MKRRQAGFGFRHKLCLALLLLVAPASAGAAPPNPILNFAGSEPYSANGKNFVRYRYDVFNKEAFPDEMFAASPELPACGSNNNAARSWVDFFELRGKRLYGFCALGSAANLGQIWFALEEGVVPPSYVYIVITDRKTNTEYKSNLADTTL